MAELTFEQLNSTETYDRYRSDPRYRNEHSEPPRYLSIIPTDREDPNEERATLVVTGRHRVGFDPRTHKAWVKNGEVIIAPLPLEAQAAA